MGGTRRSAVEATGLPGVATAFAVLVFMGAVYALVGAFWPSRLPIGYESPREMIGMALMLTLVPAYLMGAAAVAQRRSLGLIAEVRTRLAEPARADEAAAVLRGAVRRTWPVGVALGVAMGLVNTSPVEALRSETPALLASISFGQLLLWIVIGLLLCVRFTSARAFRRLGEEVEMDLFRKERQGPIARAGVVDVVIIAGALLFTPLQSLDAEFRWENYRFGLLVALPASAFFLVWPLQPLHRRNRVEREARLAAVEAQLRALGPGVPATPEASARLEALLAHRDRLRGTGTWPLSTGLLSRVGLYLILPPLAWAGAAVVERLVDRLLGG